MIQPRPTPLRRSVDTWTELDAFLADRTLDFAADVGDGETMQSIGIDAVMRSRGRLAMLTEIRNAIREAVVAEAAEQAETAVQENIEQRYKAAYGDDFDKLDTYQVEGR